MWWLIIRLNKYWNRFLQGGFIAKGLKSELREISARNSWHAVWSCLVEVESLMNDLFIPLLALCFKTLWSEENISEKKDSFIFQSCCSLRLWTWRVFWRAENHILKIGTCEFVWQDTRKFKDGPMWPLEDLYLFFCNMLAITMSLPFCNATVSFDLWTGWYFSKVPPSPSSIKMALLEAFD